MKVIYDVVILHDNATWNTRLIALNKMKCPPAIITGYDHGGWIWNTVPLLPLQIRCWVGLRHGHVRLSHAEDESKSWIAARDFHLERIIDRRIGLRIPRWAWKKLSIFGASPSEGDMAWIVCRILNKGCSRAKVYIELGCFQSF